MKIPRLAAAVAMVAAVVATGAPAMAVSRTPSMRTASSPYRSISTRTGSPPPRPQGSRPRDKRSRSTARLCAAHAAANQIHWVRDVTYDEDRSQIRTGTGPQVMAALRNAAICITGVTNIAAANRHHARYST